MGAVAGGGSDEQIEAVGEFFEALGLAFQIIDDVLNLRGFKGDLKQRGEDIANGTVTLPVAIAMAGCRATSASGCGRRCSRKPNDAPTIAAAVELVQTCGAIEACADRRASSSRPAGARPSRCSSRR